MDIVNNTPPEIIQVIYNQAYIQGFHDGQTTPPASRQAMICKRQKAYKAWLVRLGVERQMSRKRLVDPRMPHATVIPLFGEK